MEWRFDDDQLMIREMVRDFVDAEIRPVAHEWDREARFPHDVFDRLGELGLYGMTVPGRWGGADLDGVTSCIALEELARGDASTCVAISVTNSVYCAPVQRYGTDVQRRRWLEPCARGEWLGAFCLSEPDAGSDAAAVSTRAERDGDGWVINGIKSWVTNGSVCGAMLVFAVTDPDRSKGRLSAFLVPRDADGVSIVREEEKMGLRSSRTNEVAFTDCRVPGAQLLGEPGQGLEIALSSLDGGRAGIAAQAVGIARAAYEEAHQYVHERRAFGRPIGRFEGLRLELARMAGRIRAGRCLYLRAAALRDAGEPDTRAASVAKLYASEASIDVTYQAVQMHGGYGYVVDYPVERYYRDARVTTIYEGTSEIQRLVIARTLTR